VSIRERARPPPAFPLVRSLDRLSQQSAPGGIRTPNLLIRKEVRRIPLRINAFHPVLREHEVADRCCRPVSVNARPP
jgi:hypothetical protein